MKLQQKILFFMLALAMMLIPGSSQATNRSGDFTVGKGTFLLNNKPFVVKAAEVHYPRIPRPYWEQRIKMCKALGMNTLCLYVFWNIHEPQQDHFNFSGNNDVAAFCRLAQKHGMYVIVRPGPYVCAEWEMGGLPWWLLKKKDIRLREQDPFFMQRVKIFEKKVAEQLAPLTIQHGGPIIMVQVENEYGSYGEDKPYIRAIRDLLKDNWYTKDKQGNSIGPVLFQCDWSSNFTKNGLDDLVWTMNFGTGANIDQQFKRLGELRPDAPKMCSEFWSGWFDKWGARHETRPAKDMVAGIDEMLSKGISFSLYMTQATPKFYELRRTMEKYNGGKALPSVPKPAAPLVSFPKVKLDAGIPLCQFITRSVKSHDTQTFEEMDMGWGSAFYSTTLPEINQPSRLTISDAHDYAQVFINGEFVGKIDRVKNEKSIVLPPVKAGDNLDILVEAMGRINFGRAIKDYKGITGDVTIATTEGQHDITYNLKNWQIGLIPDDVDTLATQSRKPYAELRSHLNVRNGDKEPSVFLGSFNLSKVGDTFINMENFGKGQVYVNGHALGRFWRIGPQQTLYCPGCWLRKGKNSIMVLDVAGTANPVLWGQAKPELDKLQLEKSNLHNNIGDKPDLNSRTPAFSGALQPGNGWQTIRFEKPQQGRYMAILISSNQSGKDLSAIAELYLQDVQGHRISRESWTTKYADSEDAANGKDTDLPHLLVIDLGSAQTVSAMEYLPRAEQGAPGSVKDCKVYVY